MKKRRGKLIQGVLFLQDNAPAHTSHVVMTVATKCSFEVLPHSLYSLKINILGRNFGSKGVIGAVNEYLGDQEEGFYFEGISNLYSIGESASRQREIILRNNGTTSALGHSQSTGVQNFLIVPYTCKSSNF